MGKLALKIDTEGNAFEVDITENELKKLQEAVDGYIEAVDLLDFTMWVNEEGLLRNDLNRNFIGSEVCGFTIMGDIVITGKTDENGDTIGLTSDELENLTKNCEGYRAYHALGAFN